MKLNAFCMLFILSFCPYLVLSQEAHQQTDTDKVERYSVEKTLDRARKIPAGEWWGPLFQTFDPTKCPLNPEAIPEMYRILDDPKQRGDWGGMVSYIALLGGNEDVDKLESILLRYKDKKIDQGEKMFLYNILWAVSAMERHKNTKASEVVDKMMEPEYWQTLHITLPNEKDAVFVFGPGAIETKSNNADPRYKEKVQSILNRIQDTELKKAYTEAFTLRSVPNYDKVMESKRTGDWTIYYGKPASTPPPSIIIPRYYPSQDAYDLLYTSGTLWDNPSYLDAKVEEELCQEALKAFKETLQAVTKEDVNYIVTHTAVDGRPLLLKEEQNPTYIKKILDPALQMKEKWHRLIPIAKTFQEKASLPTLHSVYRCAGFGMGEKGEPLPPAPAHDSAIRPKGFNSLLLIRFRYNDLRDVAKKYPEIFNNKGRIPSVSENGEPYVVMIWEGDRWYWNPFGM